MSLIHQVLKDLDGQRNVAHGEIIGYADQENHQRLMIWPALIVSVCAAALVLYFSHYFETTSISINRAALPVIPTSGENPAVVPVITEVSAPEQTTSVPSTITSKPSAITSERQSTATDTPEVGAPETVVLDLTPKPEVASDMSLVEEVVTLNQAQSEPEPVAPRVTSAPAPVSRKEAAPAARASVTRRMDPETFYIRAVTYYQNGDWQRALAQLQEARTLGPAMEYPALQARIYLEQGMRDDFITLSDRFARNESPVWLSTVAPGLHMFGQYQAASEKYTKLIQQEPSNAQWAIARTQAQIDAGALEGARKGLQFLTENYLLSESQQDWVAFQKAVLE
ncbi:MAG: hypothetical protein VXZ24_12265 [Pseudomonadota bacterium]|nr:hypothetical protein [Pseudomonadota bacterium]